LVKLKAPGISVIDIKCRKYQCAKRYSYRYNGQGFMRVGEVADLEALIVNLALNFI